MKSGSLLRPDLRLSPVANVFVRLMTCPSLTGPSGLTVVAYEPAKKDTLPAQVFRCRGI